MILENKTKTAYSRIKYNHLKYMSQLNQYDLLKSSILFKLLLYYT